MYLVLGNFLQDDHGRAIRFVDQQKALARCQLFRKGQTSTEWCDKCICWHVRESTKLK